MIKYLPSEDPKFHNQKELTVIDDDELVDGITPVKSTTTDRVIQVLQFIFGFGWLRLILMIPLLIFYIILFIPLLVTCNNRKICDIFVPYGVFISQCTIRIAAFLMGIYKLEIKGEIDQNARVYLFNHQSILDGPLLFCIKGFTIISMIEMLKVPIFGRVLISADSVFVDRSKSSGTSSYITDAIKATKKRPVALSPEGKTTRGLYMLNFHTGGFLTDAEFQSVAIRYTTYLAYGKSGYTWCCGGFKEWIWRVFSTPCGKVTLTFLPPHTIEETKDMSPKQKAKMAHLEIANYLGVKAVSRSNVEAVKLFKERNNKQKPNKKTD